MSRLCLKYYSDEEVSRLYSFVYVRTKCILKGFHSQDPMVVVGFFRLFGHVLKVFLPNVSPVSSWNFQRTELCVLVKSHTTPEHRVLTPVL